MIIKTVTKAPDVLDIFIVFDCSVFIDIPFAVTNHEPETIPEPLDPNAYIPLPIEATHEHIMVPRIPDSILISAEPLLLIPVFLKVAPPRLLFNHSNNMPKGTSSEVSFVMQFEERRN